MSARRAGVLACLATVASSLAPAAAGPAASPAPPRRPPVCIIGRASCVTIVLAEFAVGLKWTIGADRLAVASEGGGSHFFDWEAGLLVNLPDRRNGLGLTYGERMLLAGVDTASTGPRAGRGSGSILRARYRYWLKSYLAAEGSLGLIFGARRGEAAQVALVLADQISLTLDFDRAAESVSVWEYGFSVRFGGFAAPPALLIGYAIAASGSD